MEVIGWAVFLFVLLIWFVLPIDLAISSKQVPAWVRLLFVLVATSPLLFVVLSVLASLPLCTVPWLVAFSGGVAAFVMGQQSQRREMVRAGLFLAGIVVVQAVPILWFVDAMGRAWS